MSIVIVRLPAVLARTGLSRSSAYRRINNGTFPKPIHLGQYSRAVGWLDSEIEDWLQDQVEQSRLHKSNTVARFYKEIVEQNNSCPPIVKSTLSDEIFDGGAQ